MSTEVTRHVLDNGLRVVVAREPGLPVAATSLHVGTGYRDESPGRSGFAHLFEHLVFTPREPDGVDHIRAVQARGGTANALTRPDYTCFHEVVPAAELGAVLDLGADRLRPPPVDVERLEREVRVIEREIAMTVHGRLRGGFPWRDLPPSLYRGFADTHDGYGSLDDLRRTGVDEVRGFAERHYVPANAVLTVLGPDAPEAVLGLVEHRWAALDGGPAPEPAPRDTAPEPGRARTLTRDGLPGRAVALGYRLADPDADRDEYLAQVALAALLDGEPGGPLERRVRDDGLSATGIRAHCGLFGAPLQARHPDTLVLSASDVGDHPDRVAEALHGALSGVAERGVEPDELGEAVATAATALAAHLDHPGVRCASTGLGALLHDDPALLTGLPARLGELTPAAVHRAAATAAAQRPGRVDLAGAA